MYICMYVCMYVYIYIYIYIYIQYIQRRKTFKHDKNKYTAVGSWMIGYITP